MDHICLATSLSVSRLGCCFSSPVKSLQLHFGGVGLHFSQYQMTWKQQNLTYPDMSDMQQCKRPKAVCVFLILGDIFLLSHHQITWGQTCTGALSHQAILTSIEPLCDASSSLKIVIGSFFFFRRSASVCLSARRSLPHNTFPRRHSTLNGSVQSHYANWRRVMCQTRVITRQRMQPSHVYSALAPPSLPRGGAICRGVEAVIIRNTPAEILLRWSLPSPPLPAWLPARFRFRSALLMQSHVSINVQGCTVPMAERAKEDKFINDISGNIVFL